MIDSYVNAATCASGARHAAPPAVAVADASRRADAGRRRRSPRRTSPRPPPSVERDAAVALARSRARRLRTRTVAAARGDEARGGVGKARRQDRPPARGGRCRARVPPNAARSTFAKTCAEARSGGVLSAARQSGCPDRGERAARRRGEALRRPSRPRRSRNPARARRRNPAIERDALAPRQARAPQARRRRDGRAPARSTPRARIRRDRGRRMGAASAAGDGTVERRPSGRCTAPISASVCRYAPSSTCWPLSSAMPCRRRRGARGRRASAPARTA